MKKVLSLFLVLCMILSLMVTWIPTAYADADTSIANYEQLAAFATALNADDTGMAGKTVVLTADIAMNDGFNALTAIEAPAVVWASITQAFKGTFDGGNHTISGLWINGTGFFNDLNGATIRNVTFQNCYVNNTSASGDGNGVGIVAGDVTGGTVTLSSVTTDACKVTGLGWQIGGILGGSASGTTVNMTSCANQNGIVVDNDGGTALIGGLIGQSKGVLSLTNCANTSEVRAEKNNNGGYKAGGLVGIVSGNGSTISGCSVNATVYGTTIAGGFVGQNGATITLTNCTVQGSVTTGVSGSTQSSLSRAGGFFGVSYGGSITFNGTANSNSAAVTAYPTSSNDAMAGGIIGYGGAVITAQNFTNSGTIVSANFAGGLVAQENVSGSVTFTGCSNTASVTAGVSDQTTVTCAGGFIGSNAKANITIQGNSSNSGAVTQNGTSTAYYCGGLVGNSGSANITVQNSSNTGNVTGYQDAAGIVGNTQGGGKTYTFINVTNSGDVTATTRFAGGFIARNESGSKTVITNCANEGDIYAPSQAGGLLGWAQIAAEISDSQNKGDVTSTGQKAGGLVGMMNHALTVTDSSNSGAISGSRAGGIVAAAAGSNASVSLTGCNNTGAITTYGMGNYIGGMIGELESSIGGSVTVDTCTNGGTVTSRNIGGGIAGYVCHEITISDCVNTANVSATESEAGGLVGQATAAVTVTNGYNSGAVTATKKMAGGLIGRGTGAITVSGSANSGVITAGSQAGGLVGAASQPATLTDCLNAGNVTGSDRAGGIIGYYQNVKSGSLTRCVSTGAIKGVNDCVTGTLIGDFTGTNTDNAVYITIKDCYYVKGNNYYAAATDNAACSIVAQSAGQTLGNLRIISTAKGYDAYVLGTDSEVNSLTWQGSIKKYNKAFVDGSTGAMVNAAADLQGIVGMTLLASAGYDFTSRWYVTDSYPVPVKAAINGTLNESAAVVYKGYQTKIDDSSTLRFVAGLNDLDYKNTGFDLAVAESSGVATASCSTQRVYQSLNIYNALGEKTGIIAASDYNSDYLSAISVSDLPITGTVVIVVKPFVTSESALKTGGSMIVLTFVDGVLSSQYVG